MQIPRPTRLPLPPKRIAWPQTRLRRPGQRVQPARRPTGGLHCRQADQVLRCRVPGGTFRVLATSGSTSASQSPMR